MKQSDCIGCGAPVGFIDRQYCCRCTARQKETAARADCPRCGQQRVLQEDTGSCITCSRVCTTCGHPVRNKTSTLCRDCSRITERDAAKAPCPRCDRPGYLCEDTGWCGHCSRPRQTKQPPRTCRECGRVQRRAGLGLCSACWQRHPRPALRPGRGPDRRTRTTSLLAAGLHRRSRRQVLRQPHLNNDHRPGATPPG
jgi:hypothetical protein